MSESVELVSEHPAGRGKLLALLAVVVALFLAGRFLPFADWVDGMRTWITGFGNAGPVVFVIVYVAATVLAFPGTPLTVVAAALFGSFYGTVVISIASTLGAGAAFLIARYVAREAVYNWLQDKPQFQRLESMTARRGAMVVAITRLIPLFPFNLLNYGFGLTNVPFRTYLAWSWLCMLPGTILYVVGVDAVVTALQTGGVSPTVLVAGAIALAVLIGIGRVARGKLSEIESEAI